MQIRKEKDLKSTDKGITLIALVISIIVMLILAGISLNAVIGDNGIITQAQNATYMQSVAVLEEFFNNYYIGHYEDMVKEENKIQLIKNLEPNWFYNGSPIGYIVDSSGNMHYFINKDGLPDDIKSQIKGGDAGDKSYRDYASMNDVYGITSNLKVYYCKSQEKILGTTDFDADNPLRVVFEAGSDYAKLVTGNETEEVTLEDIKGKKNLTITKDSNITDLSELYKFISLSELTLDNLNLPSLDGIENLGYLTKVIFINCQIEDYQKLNNLCNQIEEINFVNSTNIEIEKFCNNTKEKAFTKLTSLKIYSNTNIGEASERSRITDISCLANLNIETKNNIQYLDLNSNKITSIVALADFINIKELKINSNLITSLDGIENMNSLAFLNAEINKLGKAEVYDTSLENNGRNTQNDALAELANKKNLEKLYLYYNTDLKWTSYLSNLNKLEQLDLSGCPNLVISDLTTLRDIWNNLSMKEINSNKLIAFNSDNIISLASSNLTDSSEEFQSLYNNNMCEKLSLEGNVNLSDEKINEVLASMENLKYLSLKGISNFKNLDFITENSKLIEIDLRGTSCIDLTNLNYCNDLKNLAVDNIQTDFTGIQERINNMYSNINSYWGNYIGFYIGKLECAKNLNICTNITKLNMRTWGEYTSGNLDLTGCSSLEKISGMNTMWHIIVPSNLKCWDGHHLSSPILTYAYSLTDFVDIACDYTQEEMNDVFSNLKKCKNLRNINIRVYNASKTYNLEKIKELKECAITKITLGSYSNEIGKNAFSSLEDISEITTLEELTVYSQNNLSSTKGIEKLTNLKKIDLHDSGVTNLTGIEELSNLEEINLNNTNLYDTYVNTNTGENLRTLQVLGNLNYKKNGNLQRIYLEGLSKITDWTEVSSLSWINKTGF